jgi:hypothetical protein
MKKVIQAVVIGILGFALATGTCFAYNQIVKAETVDGIPYATGGVGKTERAALENMSSNYNVKLVFARANGSYLALMPVLIKDLQGNILIETQSAGPWFLTKLPEGQYKVIVGPRTNEKIRTISVGDKSKTVMFHWKR